MVEVVGSKEHDGVRRIHEREHGICKRLVCACCHHDFVVCQPVFRRHLLPQHLPELRKSGGAPVEFLRTVR